MVLNEAGSWFVRVTHLPVPGSVVGLIVLAVLIETRILPLALVRSAAELLVRHLALLYVPAGVALLAYWGAVRHDLVAITVAALASLVAVLLVVAHTVQRLERDE
ncbi:MAG TPA: CidA/LrgA family protein [Gammaproteobacteria bacterium]|nr:CidA/LrgA family protein [Gammaproteobacteria bacterium]